MHKHIFHIEYAEMRQYKTLDHLAPRNHIICAFNLVSLWFIASIVRIVNIL